MKPNTKKIVVAVAVGLVQCAAYALACHSAGLNAHGYAIVPLAAGAGSGWYFFKTSGLQ